MVQSFISQIGTKPISQLTQDLKSKVIKNKPKTKPIGNIPKNIVHHNSSKTKKDSGIKTDKNITVTTSKKGYEGPSGLDYILSGIIPGYGLWQSGQQLQEYQEYMSTPPKTTITGPAEEIAGFQQMTGLTKAPAQSTDVFGESLESLGTALKYAGPILLIGFGIMLLSKFKGLLE